MPPRPLSFLLVVLCACTSGPSAGERKQENATSFNLDGEISARKVHGTWVFFGRPPERGKAGDIKIIRTDALHSGHPTIENGCLLLDGAAIVWWDDQVELANRVVLEAKDNSPNNLSIPGEGVTDQAPALVVARCGVEKVLYANGRN